MIVTLSPDDYTVLKSAAEWMLDEATNTKDSFAILADGTSCLIFDQKASCYCAAGKIMKVANDHFDYTAQATRDCPHYTAEEIEARAFLMADTFTGELSCRVAPILIKTLPIAKYLYDQITDMNDEYGTRRVGEVILEAMASGEIAMREAV